MPIDTPPGPPIAWAALETGDRPLVRVSFTPNLQRHVEVPSTEVVAATVAEALGRVFEREPRLRGYIVDEHGALRPHVAVFVDGAPVRDRVALSDRLTESSEVCVMQALSGG